jgi:hypothetical protein
MGQSQRVSDMAIVQMKATALLIRKERFELLMACLCLAEGPKMAAFSVFLCAFFGFDPLLARELWNWLA